MPWCMVVLVGIGTALAVAGIIWTLFKVLGLFVDNTLDSIVL